MPLHRSLKAIYVIDLLLSIVTCITLIPIAQMHDTQGNEISDIQLVITVFKVTALILSLMFLRRVVFYMRMKENSKRVYMCQVILLISTILQDLASIYERQIASEQKVFLGWIIF